MTSSSRAWGWVAHLIGGGTTPYAQWSTPGPPVRDLLPGAQQLEFVRRLNMHDPGHAEVVFGTELAGRGQQLLALPDTAARFGTPAEEPTLISSEELVRVGRSVLAKLAATAPLPPEPAPPGSILRRLALPAYEVAGDPLLADEVRRVLTRAGRPPGGRRPRILVAVPDQATYLADAWQHRVFHGASVTWRDWVARNLRHGGGVRPVLLAREAAARVGAERVLVVPDVATALRALKHRSPAAEPLRLGRDAIEIARKVNETLRSQVAPDRRIEVMHGVLRPWLAQVDELSPARPRIPARLVDALREAHEIVSHELSDAGYPSLGSRGNPELGSSAVGVDLLTVLVRTVGVAVATKKR